MGYIKSIDKMKDNAKKALTADDIRKDAKSITAQKQEAMNRRDSAISSLIDLIPVYNELQQKAHDEKDRLTFIYSTGVIFFLDHLELITAEMESFELERILDFLNQLPSNVNEENLLKLKQLCEYHLLADVYELRVQPDVECTNYTIGDLIGMGISLLRFTDNVDEYKLFK